MLTCQGLMCGPLQSLLLLRAPCQWVPVSLTVLLTCRCASFIDSPLQLRYFSRQNKMRWIRKVYMFQLYKAHLIFKLNLFMFIEKKNVL